MEVGRRVECLTLSNTRNDMVNKNHESYLLTQRRLKGRPI